MTETCTGECDVRRKTASALERQGDSPAGTQDPREAVSPSPQTQTPPRLPTSRAVPPSLTHSLISPRPSRLTSPGALLLHSRLSQPGTQGPVPGLSRSPPPGSHSLKCIVTATSRPVRGESHIDEIGYVDDTQFLRFEFDAASRRVEPQTPWMTQEGLDYWDREIQYAKELGQIYRHNLQIALRFYNQSEDGE